MSLNLIYRPPTEDDLNFILSRWLLANRNSDLCNYLDNDTYYSYYQAIIKNTLLNAKVVILANSEDITHIYGFVVYNDTTDFILHCIYIKPLYRGFKLSTAVLRHLNPNLVTRPTYLTSIDPTTTYLGNNNRIKRHSLFIKNRERLNLHYNPFLIIGTNENRQ